MGFDNYTRLSSRKYKEICISNDFERHQPKPSKLISKIKSYCSGEALDAIIVDESMTLIDGYCTYLIVNILKIPKRRFRIYMVKERR